MNKVKQILAAIGVIVLLLAVFKITQNHYETRISEAIEETRVEKIRASKLEKIADGHYQKLVADTLTINELKKDIDSLKIVAKTPKIVEKVVLSFVEVDKPIDGIVVTDTTVTVEDSYPNKENPFVTYNFNLNLLTKQSIGKFSFNKIPIDIVVSEEPGGLHKADIIAPEFIIIDEFTFKSLPMVPYSKDHFGWLAGAGYYKNIIEQKHGLELTGGIRYKKVYLLGSFQTNSSLGMKALIEF